MQIKRLLHLVAFSCFFQSLDAAQTLYVTNSNQNSVTPIDTTTGIPGTDIGLGTGSLPRALAITPDGQYVYVCKAGSSFYAVTPIDTTTGIPGTDISVGANPTAIAIAPNGQYAYVCNSSASSVSVINIGTNQVDATITVGSTPQAVVIAPDGQYAYVANNGSSSVSVINTVSKVVTNTISVGSTPRAMAITPDGTQVYVCNAGSRSVSVINTVSKVVTNTISVGTNPRAIAITPDGQYAYVANYGSGSVSVLSTGSTPAVVNTITVGTLPQFLAITPDGAQVYVVNFGDHTISVITNSGVSTITLPNTSALQSIIMNPNGQAFYVGDTNNASVYAITTDSLHTRTTVSNPGDQPNSFAMLAPSGVYQAVTVPEGSSGYPITLSGIDPNGQSSSTLTYNVVQNPIHGSVLISGNVATYTPTSSTFTGSDLFTFTVTNSLSQTSWPVPVKIAVVPPQYIYTCDSSGLNVLTPIEISANPPIAGLNIPVGSNPRGIAITPDGSKAYTCNYVGNSVSVINTSTNQLITNISVGNNPNAIAITPDGSKAYTCNVNGNSVSVIDTSTNQLITNISVGTSPNALVISQDGTVVYVNNFDGTVRALDTSNYSNVQTINNAGDAYSCLLMSPDGTKVYNARVIFHDIVVIDTSNYSNVSYISLVDAFPLLSTQKLAISPDGATLFACELNGIIEAISTSNYSKTTINFGSLYSVLYSVAITPDGSMLYVSDNGESCIGAIDTSNYNNIQTILIPNSSPATLGMIPDGSAVYVADSASAYLYAVSTSNNTVQSIDLNGIYVTRFGIPTPSGLAQLVTVPKGSPGYAITLSGIDPLGQSSSTLTYSVVQQPVHGSISQNGNIVTYTPTSPTFTGSDVFTFTVTDFASGLSVPVPISIKVGAPTANAQTINVVADSSGNSITLTGTHNGGTGSFTFAIPGYPNTAHGTLSGLNTSTGAVTYTPTSGYGGQDSFTFTVTDTAGTSFAAIVIINVGIPIANPQTVGVSKDSSGNSITLTGTHNGGTGSFTFAIPGYPNTAHGTLSGLNTSTGAVTYTPTSGYTGSDSFTFTVADTAGTSSPATVSITVADFILTPTTPVAVVINGTVTVSLNPSGGATPYQSYTAVSAPSAGTLGNFNTSTGTIDYTSTGSTPTTDNFTVTITDANGIVSTQGAVSVTVETAPVGTPATFGAVNGVLRTYQLAATGGTSPYTYAVASAPSHTSAFSISSSGLVSYTANTGSGTDSFTFTVTDNVGVQSAPATVSVNLEATVPVGTPVTFGAANGVLRTYQLAATGGTSPYTYAVASAPSHTSAFSISSSGLVSYTANTGSGTDSFTFTVTDNIGVQSAPATVSVNLEATVPTATTTAITASPVLNVQTNTTLGASGGSGTYSTYTLSGQTSAHGTITQPSGTGSSAIRYTSSGSVGTDSFSYTVTDSLGLVSSPVTVTIYADTNPTAISRTVSSVAQGSTLNPITLTGSDPAGQTLSYALVSGTTAQGGTVTQNSVGSANVLYTPNPSFSGPTDSFTFTVTNSPSGLTSSPGTITIPIVSGDVPVANDQSAYTVIATPIGINLYGSDPGSLPITFVLDTLPSFGTIQSLTVSGAYSAIVQYKPNAGYYGQDSFTFFVNNGTSNSNIATVSLTINNIEIPEGQGFVGNMISKYHQPLTEQ